jgi:hypothetical protein
MVQRIFSAAALMAITGLIPVRGQNVPAQNCQSCNTATVQGTPDVVVQNSQWQAHSAAQVTQVVVVTGVPVEQVNTCHAPVGFEYQRLLLQLKTWRRDPFRYSYVGYNLSDVSKYDEHSGAYDYVPYIPHNAVAGYN